MAWSGSEDEFEEFVARHGLTFPQISDPGGEVFSRFGVAYQPAFAIVTTDGEVQTLTGAADEATLDGLVDAAA